MSPQVFPYDDSKCATAVDRRQAEFTDLWLAPNLVFDNGCLREHPEESKIVMESLMLPMLGKVPENERRLRIVQIHDTVVERVFAVCISSWWILV